MPGKRPLLLDLFSGAGGSAAGYHRAGFDVIGVDHRPMKRYPFPFIQADALEFLASAKLGQFDLIHASPPCQAYSVATLKANRGNHPDLLAKTRALLIASGRPYVIENVPGAPMAAAVILCGSHFGLRGEGTQLVRHRLFEAPWLFALVPPCDHRGVGLSVAGNRTTSHFRRAMGRSSTARERRDLMGIDWTNREELAQSIPPAYTEWIGARFFESFP